MKRHVLIVSGPGFAEQADLVRILEARGDDVKVVPAWSEALASEAEVADAVLLRGAWTASPEEKLLARSLADTIEPALRVLDRRLKLPPEQQPVIVGVGRGALVLLASKSLALGDFDRLAWTRAFDESTAWIDVRFRTDSKESFPALITGRALPASDAFAATLDPAPWIFAKRGGGESFGWRLRHRVYLSFVDTLAFGERSQLTEYGYRDLLALPSQTHILQTTLGGDT